MNPLTRLRLGDVATFLAVRRHGAVSAAARELDVTPSQVSKAVERLGVELGEALLARTGRGVALTDAGRRLAPALEDVLLRLDAVRRGETSPTPDVTIAAPSYLASTFLSRIAAALPGMRVRGVEMAPTHIRAYSTERFFDVAITVGLARLPKKIWSSRTVGPLRKGLFASVALAKKLQPFPVSVDRLRAVPFIAPVLLASGQFVAADDDCPLPRAERRLGHEAQTIGVALDLAARTEQLAFGPAIASRLWVERGLLVEIPVRGWSEHEPLRVLCHGDRVRAPVQKAIVGAVHAGLVELSAPPRAP